jgi:hypothetical protein
MTECHSILSVTRILKGMEEFIICKDRAPTGEVTTSELSFNKETIAKIAPFYTDKTHFYIRNKIRLYGVPRQEWEVLGRDALIDYRIYGHRRDHIATS